ncbi:MAG: hypothetical protein HY317_02170 [Acidobacteria bacterium]|nr:hypothetical protein [Acidobacteriota bacterium]
MGWGDKRPARLALELTAASFVALFQELALIRWLPGQVRVLAYFPNLVLLSAFLGLGLGCLLARRRSLVLAWPLSLAAVVLGGAGMSRIAFTQASSSEHLFLLYYDLPQGSPVVQDVALPLVVTFVLSTLSFVPLGQVIADRLNAFRARASALLGYSWDILGSLLGVMSFAVVSFSGSFPVTWFSVFLAFGLFFVNGPAWRKAFHLLVAALVVMIVGRSERADRYSPYYALRIDQEPELAGFAVLANGSLHQWASPVRRSDEGLTRGQQTTRDGYHLPYGLLGRRVRNALVVGAGTGNDVAVLLDEGAERVDAVEIDPVILDMGLRHPNRPYASPRVRVINTDARSYLDRTSEKYDLIVFGTLDSMTRLSALSNVRLDNFVYTTDCVRAARDRLTPDGGLVLYYMVGVEYIDLRLVGMLTEVFGEAPLGVARHYRFFNRILMAGPAFAPHGGAERRADAPRVLERITARVELPGDDWPFLYLRQRGIHGFYLKLMAAFGALTVLGVALASGEMRRGLGSLRQADWEMFLFGLAFLLLETRSVTEMNLAWGGTWLTNAVVFGSILGVILLGTLLTRARPLPFHWGMGGLVVSLLTAYAVPARVLVGADVAGKLALSILFVGSPIFFAALSFAALFRDREQAAAAFGWNLLGAVTGGLLEFASMAIGLKALLLVALAAYLLAVLVRLRRAGAVPVVGAAPEAAGSP